MPEATDDQRLQTYIHGLKPHIQEELELHNTSTMGRQDVRPRLSRTSLNDPIKVVSTKTTPRGILPNQLIRKLQGIHRRI